MRRLLKAAGHPYLPITSGSLIDLMAALDAAKYRSPDNYLSDWKRQHAEAGHVWTGQLDALRKDMLRATSRGKGPPRRAETFGAEDLPAKASADPAPAIRGGPRFPHLLRPGTGSDSTLVRRNALGRAAAPRSAGFALLSRALR